MRCYFFTNFYYSSIQKGIQPLHAVVRMFTKYAAPGKKNKILFEWAENHETVICLNGGRYSDMAPLLEFLDKKDNPYPFAPFMEEKDAMGAEVLTSIGIVLPEKIYLAAELMRKRIVEFSSGTLNIIEDRMMASDTLDEMKTTLKGFGEYSDWERQFIVDYLNKCGLSI